MEWRRHCDLLAWCLMPNHFHFIIVPKPSGCTYIVQKEIEVHLQKLSYVIGKTLSSYTRAINKEQNRCGELFQKKTKAKCLFQESVQNIADSYLFNCFSYVHFNPVQAGLTASAADWPFSSPPDYLGKRNGTLCNKVLLFKFGGFSQKDALQASGWNPEILQYLFDASDWQGALKSPATGLATGRR